MDKIYIIVIIVFFLHSCTHSVDNSTKSSNRIMEDNNKIYYKNFDFFDLKLKGKIQSNDTLTYPFVEQLQPLVLQKLVFHLSKDRRDSLEINENKFTKYSIRHYSEIGDSYVEQTIYSKKKREVFLFKIAEGKIYLEEYSIDRLLSQNQIVYEMFSLEYIIREKINIENLTLSDYKKLMSIIEKDSNISIAWKYTYEFNHEKTLLHRVHYYPLDEEIILDENSELNIEIGDYFWLDYFSPPLD